MYETAIIISVALLFLLFLYINHSENFIVYRRWPGRRRRWWWRY